MAMSARTLRPDYQNSWALLIGIDDYGGSLPPLGTATKGVGELSKVLRDSLRFQPDHIITLTNGQATQRAIRRALTDPLSRADKVSPNDRVILYFAGHGLTFDTAQGEVGCIAPYDVESGYIDSTVPMDELTRLANRIHAKHVLFLFDACFSGFATTRDVSAGVERQIKDFLIRPARQVITAGTREQAVSDTWGPGGHSLFTGFLLDGLRGSAPAPGGILRAFHLAGYLQDQVAQHSRSLQTPQYAALMGSQGGDFIFSVRRVAALSALLLAATESDDASERLLAVGRLRAYARGEGSPEEAAQALAKLEEMASNDADPLVRSSADAAIQELVPQTFIAPVVRENLADLAHEKEGRPATEPDRPVSDMLPEAVGVLHGQKGPASGVRYDITTTPVTIGRTPNNDLPIKDTRISRHHARITERDDGLWIEDLGSTNKTYVNGQPIDEPRRLSEGDVIRVGSSALTFRLPESESAPAAAMPGPVRGTPAEALSPVKPTEPTQFDVDLSPEFEAEAGAGEYIEVGEASPTERPRKKLSEQGRKRLLIVVGIIAACIIGSCLLSLIASSGGY
jgi:pSer/pThr/pTyr-binding forkhead associated (FHA) protein